MNINAIDKLPFNIDLLQVQESDLSKVGKISESKIFDNMNNFHSEGLFSTTIFGAVGSEYRAQMFGYIDLKITIFHPLVYYAIINLKAFYKQIAEGKVTAIFNPKTGEFEKSNSEEASTGIHFLYSHTKQLKFEKNQSDKRNFLIDMFNEAVRKNNYSLRYLLVIPAGIRDYIVDENGKPQEDEINSFYRRLISQSTLVNEITAKKAPEVYDSLAIGMQNTTLELFEYLKSLLEGKNKLILGKWLSRKIFNSTRNVLSSSIDKSSNVNDQNRLGYNQCLVGLHQFIRAAVPKSTYEIKNKYIKNVFIENSSRAILVNTKTLLKEEVENSSIQKEYDLWTSSEELLKTISMLENLTNRNDPIVLNKGKHYLGLLYRDDKYFKFFSSIDELPDTFSKDKVTPVSLGELMYMSVYDMNGKYPGFVTRYPITGYGSVYPAYVKFITTTESDTLEELDENWFPSGKIASSFPRKNSNYFNTCAVHPSHLGALGGDYDGDTVSLTMLLSDEAIEEVNKFTSRREYYVNNENEFVFSCDTDILSAVFAFMT